jgi:hypothetical protein
MLESLMLTEREAASSWCERHLVFPRDTSPNAPGPLSFERQPYLREILDCAGDPSVESVFVSGGAQIGKSALLIAMLGYFIAQQPANGIWAMTSLEQVRLFSRKRVMPFIKANGMLARYVKQNDPAAFQALNYELMHMNVRFVGTGSPANLASESCAWVIGDEAAKWPHNAKEEAPPLQLIQERTKGFPRRFHLFTSTPTNIENEFWQGFAGSEMRQYFMPCPYCEGEFAFTFTRETMRWDKPENGHIDIDLAAATVRYVCPHCGGEIWEEQKAELMAKGRWKPSEALQKEYGSETVQPSSKNRGYHIDSLYSPFVSWGKCVRAFLECYTKLTVALDLQNFRNSWCGLPYEHTKVTVKPEHITALCGAHRRGVVPGEPYYVSVGYDPGGNQTHWCACAVYEGGKMLVIDWGTILQYRTEYHLEPDGEGINAEWRPVVDKAGVAPHFSSLRWRREDGEEVVPYMGFVDAGYSTGDIYDECNMQPGVLMPTKGASEAAGTWYMRKAGDAWPGLPVLQYSDHNAKMSLYARTVAKGEAPQLVLPVEEECDMELLRGLSGQKLVRKGEKEVWRRVPEDHYGDCIKLQRIGWWVLGRRFEASAVLPVEESAVDGEGE